MGGRKHAAGSWLPCPAFLGAGNPSHASCGAGTASAPSRAAPATGLHAQHRRVLHCFVVGMSSALGPQGSALLLLSCLRLLTALLLRAMCPFWRHRCRFHVHLCSAPPGLWPWRNPGCCVLQLLATDPSLRDGGVSFLPLTCGPQLGHGQEQGLLPCSLQLSPFPPVCPAAYNPGRRMRVRAFLPKPLSHFCFGLFPVLRCMCYSQKDLN